MIEHFCGPIAKQAILPSQMMDIVDMAIQVGGARESQSFVFRL
jgi:hypothetical protein